MKLDEIFAMWDEDTTINPTQLDAEALKIPKLHNKYYRVFSQERLGLKKLETDYKKLYHLKYDWLLGVLDKETLEENNWKQNPRNILKSDIPMHIDSDQDIINLTLKISYQKEKITLLESIIKNISDRGYMISNAINWQKFTNGLS